MRKIEAIHVVPKKYVDKAMAVLAGNQKLNNKELARVRGLLYCETFLATRITVTVDVSAPKGEGS